MSALERIKSGALERRLRNRLKLKWGAQTKIGEPMALVDYDDLRDAIFAVNLAKALASEDAVKTVRTVLKPHIAGSWSETMHERTDRVTRLVLNALLEGLK